MACLKIECFYKLRDIEPLALIVDQQLCAGAGVAGGLVVVKGNMELAAHRIEFMVAEGGVADPTHAAGAGIKRLRLPPDRVVIQAFSEHAHIERRIVRNKDAVCKQVLQNRPKRQKIGLVLNCLRTNAGEADIEGIKIGFGVDQGAEFADNLAVFYDHDADGTHPVIVAVRRFYVKNGKAVCHVLSSAFLPFILAENRRRGKSGKKTVFSMQFYVENAANRPKKPLI